VDFLRFLTVMFFLETRSQTGYFMRLKMHVWPVKLRGQTHS